ncbi:hypothetical protein LCGC14_2746580 [marine sediment metagenome]|uniref:DUF559 domain-containing protein n=1 Tax=marine sediment metagenome TaxID=412755 RepID=A0A0F9BBS1_9ZZZZ
MRRKLSDVQARDLRRRYEGGESELSLSKSFGVARGGVRRYLLRGGIRIRSISEANKLRMARLSPAERSALTSAAHAAIRKLTERRKSRGYEIAPSGSDGRAIHGSEEHRCKIAVTREKRQRGISPEERKMDVALRRRGLHTTLQKAVGRYNIDVAVAEGRIAVDVFGGHWHASGRHAGRFRKRLNYIADKGWLPIIVWITGDYPLQRKAVDYIVSLSKRRCAGEAFTRQEHVIRGDGEPTGIGKSNLDYRAAVGGDKTGDLVRGEDGRFTNQAVWM